MMETTLHVFYYFFQDILIPISNVCESYDLIANDQLCELFCVSWKKHNWTIELHKTRL